jgi:hypothetical protein
VSQCRPAPRGPRLRRASLDWTHKIVCAQEDLLELIRCDRGQAAAGFGRTLRGSGLVRLDRTDRERTIRSKTMVRRSGEIHEELEAIRQRVVAEIVHAVPGRRRQSRRARVARFLARRLNARAKRFH